MRPLQRPQNLSLFLALVLVLPGCSPATWSSAESAYARGDMVGSVNYAVQTLREKPGYEDAVTFLVDLLPQLYTDNQARAEQAAARNDWATAYARYNEIQRVSNLVAALPPQPHPETGEAVSFPTRNVQSEIAAARNNLAEYHYQTGLRLEGEERHIEAARAYRDALQTIDGYKDAAARYEVMREKAVRRIAVLPLRVRTPSPVSRGVGENIADFMITEIMSTNPEFMELIARDRLDLLLQEHGLAQRGILDRETAAEAGKILGLDFLLYGTVTSVVTEGPRTSTSRKRERAQITENEQKKTIEALVTIKTRRARAKVEATYQLVDVSTGRMLKSDRAEAEEEDVKVSCAYQGDERAISRATRAQCTDEADDQPRPIRELIDEAAKKIASTLAGQITAEFQ